VPHSASSGLVRMAAFLSGKMAGSAKMAL
jgi:hypothetical protein